MRPLERPLSIDDVVKQICDELLLKYQHYLGTYRFGTRGGNDVDLRPCFEREPSLAEQAVLRRQFQERMVELGVTTELDLLFMAQEELTTGRIRDLVEHGDVTGRLLDGFDPHELQAAVGDTSLFSLYIIATLLLIHHREHVSLPSANDAIQRVVLTRDGAVGWMHYYTACFLHEYLRPDRPAGNLGGAYVERLAKFFCRVSLGNTLAQLSAGQLATIQPTLVTAIHQASATRSADATMNDALLADPYAGALLDPESQRLLRVAGNIRSGSTPGMAPEIFVPAAESLLFYKAFDQGSDRRTATDENADPLTSHVLGTMVRHGRDRRSFRRGTPLMTQGEHGKQLFFLPLKTTDRRSNGYVTITVRDAHGDVVQTYQRNAGRVVGEGAIFGFPRSATVTAGSDLEAYVLDAAEIRDLLTDDAIYTELQQPVLETPNARMVDVLLRYFARDAGIFLQQTQPYTRLTSSYDATARFGPNPLDRYRLDGATFHDYLLSFVDASGEGAPAPVAIVGAGQDRTLFPAGKPSERFYVVSRGSAAIRLTGGRNEEIALKPHEYFGESSLSGLPAGGTAVLTAGSEVLSVDPSWFQRHSQSRQPAVNTMAEQLLPVQLGYHLAAEGYERVRRRLATQVSPIMRPVGPNRRRRPSNPPRGTRR